MKAFVGQIYIQPGITYPFSHVFQKWASIEISKRIKPSSIFLKKYSDDFEIMFRMSAKAELNNTEISGPTVYRKNKDIEFTIFLPYLKSSDDNHEKLKQPLKLFFDGVSIALESLGIDSSNIKKDSLDLIKKAISDPSMFE
jgi:hypothetical protein